MLDKVFHRVLRVVLGLLPRGIHEQYAFEIITLTFERRRELRDAGHVDVTRFWLREIVGAMSAVLAAWWDLGPILRRASRGVRPWIAGEHLRFALRTVRRHPWQTAAIVMSLATSLGASVAVISIVDGVVLDPLSLPDADRLVRVFQAADPDRPDGGTSYPMLMDYRTADHGLIGPAGVATLEVGIRVGDSTDRVLAGLVTGDFFDIVGAGPYRGRTLRSPDDVPGSPPVVLLGYTMSERFFGEPVTALGRTMWIGGDSFEVVGITPPQFRGISLEAVPELWIPLSRVRDVADSGLFAAPNILSTRSFAWIDMVARVSEVTTARAAESRLAGVARGVRERLGEASGLSSAPRPIRLAGVAESAVPGDRTEMIHFLTLLGCVVLLTFIAGCASAAHLLWARSQARADEMRVRRILGAGRARILGHVLLESAVLAFLGAGLGLVLAFVQLDILRSFSLPGGIPMDRLDLSLDAQAVAVAAVLALVSASVVSVAPALSSLAKPRTRMIGAGHRLGAGLLSAQVAVSLVLVFGAMLFGRTLQAALHVDLGFEPEAVGAVTSDLRGRGSAPEEMSHDAERLVTAAESAPSILRASVSIHVPLAPPALRLRPARVGQEADDRRPIVNVNVVTAGYFEVLGIPTLLGRTFRAADRGGKPVAVLNEAAVASLRFDQQSVDQRVRLFPGVEPVTVVGVVADHRVHGIRDATAPYLFLPASQYGQLLSNGVHVIAKSALDGEDALIALSSRLRADEPWALLKDARVLSVQVERALMTERLAETLLTLLAAVTLAVSAIGVYGMISFSVERRRADLGIRVALGANRCQIVGTALAGTLAVVAIGIGTGLLAGAALSRLVEDFLFGIGPRDPPSFVGATLVLMAIALVAAAAPVFRVLRIDPRQVVAEGS